MANRQKSVFLCEVNAGLETLGYYDREMLERMCRVSDLSNLLKQKSKTNPNFYEVSVPKGFVLCSEGDDAQHLYVVLTGSLEIFDDSTKQRIAIISKGSAVGEQAVLLGGRRSASVRAIEDSVCLEISGTGLRNTLMNQTSSVQALLSCLLLQLIVTNQIRQIGINDTQQGRVIDLDVNTITNGKSRLELQALLKSSEHTFSAVQSLFLRVMVNDELESIAVSSPHDILREYQRGNGLVITSGTVTLSNQENSRIQVGPGGVLGVAEVLSQVNFADSFEISQTVNALVIPVSRVSRSIKKLNKGLKGVFRAVVMRILRSDERPEVFQD